MGRSLLLRAEFLQRDWVNRWRYGSGAPRCAERVWIDPREVVERVRLRDRKGRKLPTGSVVSLDRFDGAMKRSPVRSSRKVRACIEHWRDGVPWEETGVLDTMRRRMDRPRGWKRSAREHGVEELYRSLDRIFETVRDEGRLRTRVEIDPDSFREEGGIAISIDGAGRLLHSGNGHHRLAIALVLGLSHIPAQLHVIDPAAIPLLPALRTAPGGVSAHASVPAT